MTRSFSITWDYRCPFARNAHEHVLDGLAAGADWDVTFVPFSLGQVHVAEGDTDVWDEPSKDSGIVALQAGVVVRDRWPDLFPAVHRALFAARHDESRKLQDPTVVPAVLADNGVDAAEVMEAIADGRPLKQVRLEHEAAVQANEVWGVPTFVAGDQAVFIRLMNRSEGDTDLAIRTIERVLDLIGGFPELNEYKHTSIKR
jgi:protein-disulfide isomerase-like protein with CxxC motif